MRKIKQIVRTMIVIAFGVAIILSFTSCQKKGTLEKNKAIVQNAYEEIWNQGNLDTADNFFTADYVYHAVPEIHGTEGVKQHVAALRTSFPDFQLSIEDMIAEGDKVVSRWAGGGTQKKEYMGIPSSGKKGNLTGIIVTRIENGKIAEEWETSDQLGMLQLLGVIPPMPDAPLSVLKRTKPDEFLWGEDSKVTGDPGDAKTNRAIVLREEEEVWNQRNPDTFDAVFSVRLINHDPGTPDIRDYEDFRQFWTMVGTVTKDYHLTVDDMIAEKDKVAVRWSSRFIEAATGKPVNNKGILIYRLADGKIVESWFSTDMLGFMRQLGVLPS